MRLREQEEMVEIMDETEELRMEEKVTCIDCNISVPPSNIQVNLNKQKVLMYFFLLHRCTI